MAAPLAAGAQCDGVYGDEHNREGRGDLGRDIDGASADVTVSPSPFWALNAGFALRAATTTAPIPLLDVDAPRRQLLGVSLGAIYLINRN